MKRTARVRNRLVLSVAVVAAAVAGAGAPGVAIASGGLTDSQQLVTLSELNAQAVVLAHALADERDTMTRYVAAGRTTASGAAGVSEKRRAGVDRRLDEIRENAPADLRRRLAELPEVRQGALAGKGSAADTFAAYTELVQALHAVSADVARSIPARASGGPAEALPSLGRAVEHAAATRTLLLSNLVSGGGEGSLTETAQRTHVQEQAALADFEETAPAAARESYGGTVNGTETTAAERYLTDLTDQPRLSDEELALDQESVDTALSGRIDLMRAVESALTTAESSRLAELRDDDVTALELRIAFLAVCMLIAIGSGTSAARSMTRPLAALRLGARRVAADPVGEEPVRFTGRNDEYAEAVRAVNELRDKAVAFHATAEQLGGERGGLLREQQRLTDQRAELDRQRAEVAERLTGLQGRVQGSFVNLSLRTLGLIERQLGVIEALEESEREPERLDTLYKLDHLATRMRRHSENLLVLAGAEHGTGHSGPVPLLDVLRASVSEIERYERVRIQSLPPHSRVAGFAADAVSHLVSELLENASGFSPPETEVELSGWLLESGEVMLSIQDEGIGMTAGRLAELNARLADPDAEDAGEDEAAFGLGLYVVARLAARHGIRVELRDQKQRGVAAVVVLPTAILPTRPAPSAAPAGRTAVPEVSLPGSVAEANSNDLPRRRGGLHRRPDPAGAPGAADPLSGVEPAVGATAAGEAAASPRTAGADGPRRRSELARSAEHDPLVAAAEEALRAASAGAPGTDPAGSAPGATVPEQTAPPAAPTAGPFPDAAATAPGSAETRAGARAEAASEASSAEADPTAPFVPGGADTASAAVPGAADVPGATGATGGEAAPEAADGLRTPPARDSPPLPSSPESGPYVTVPRDSVPARPAARAEGTGGFPIDDPYGVRLAGGDQHARAEDGDGRGGDQPARSSPLPHRTDGPAPDDAAQPATAPAATAPETAVPAGDTAWPEPGRVTAPAPGTGAAAPAAATGTPEPAAPAAEGGTPGGTPGGTAQAGEAVTGMGLPKRRPKVVAAREPVRERAEAVDAEALRRRLGGFHQGARDGRRDAEAELAEQTGEHHTGGLDEGGTVEEARG